ncbi:hypothetical protein [Cytobacillus sp. IB215665]|uniref:hypothetical protein n=1 Tax=Cytobacillus sp. IB215665 TaxID=3097357 RepID=UPI002A12DD90|nr:hypothetical protein [Cytobacillus sp. IB215665]MDX8365512.1 hypothetical protein [Cytobacillus sp. IB215665]
MVIQSNMSPKGIVDIWKETEVVFNKYNVPITTQSLEILVKNELLHSLLKELNSVVGSSTVTCIEGG